MEKKFAQPMKAKRFLTTVTCSTDITGGTPQWLETAGIQRLTGGPAGGESAGKSG